ncbi:class I SAM-dependent methyltransferase [uncultured Chitinophaga sp.]|jgi:Predicted O-methyltransferase|uniref:class I SAM-dependent methyltransferase n=1 Tax=uncultured Chitinophaga sp. TaxID=339340 RepID=UPI00262447E3|nr:class I SAM-dependent methyltransferase [uncultured Chitinophaga sp.]
MNALLEHVFEKRQFTNSNNEVVAINSETPKGQCEFLQTLIREHNFSSAIEVGLAHGTSTLAIAEAVAENKGSSVAMDPYERSYWNSVGLDLVAQAGYQVEFIEDFSYRVIPKFLEAGRKFDFAYVDSTKLTDWLMTDFFLIDKALVNGGIIVFDDVNYPSIRKLVRYIAQLPHYQVVGSWPYNNRWSAARKVAKNWLTLGLRDGLSLKDFRLGLIGRSVALRKTGDDTREYDWHRKF